MAATQNAITIYNDELCTELADIATLQNAAIEDSVLRIGTDYRLPRFLGPSDGATILWASGTIGPSFRLTADYEIRLENIESGAAAAVGVPTFVGNSEPETDAPSYVWFHQVDDIWVYTIVDAGGSS